MVFQLHASGKKVLPNAVSFAIFGDSAVPSSLPYCLCTSVNITCLTNFVPFCPIMSCDNARKLMSSSSL